MLDPIPTNPIAFQARDPFPESPNWDCHSPQEQQQQKQQEDEEDEQQQQQQQQQEEDQKQRLHYESTDYEEEDYEESSIHLDEDGFSFLQSNDQQDDSQQQQQQQQYKEIFKVGIRQTRTTTTQLAQFPQQEEEEEEEEQQQQQRLHNESASGSLVKSSFAADFYQSGTDWSSLVKSSSENPVKLKQRDLFQMWGLKRSSNGVEENEDMKNKKSKKNETQLGFESNLDMKIEKNENHLGLKTNGVGKSNAGSSLDLGATRKGKLVTRQGQPCPFYKKIPGTNFTVDAFRYGAVKDCSAYFLSHFHADHYGGLSKAWSHGPIYCTPITARLVRMCLSVNPSFICPLELDVENIIDGIRVTLLEANHCPGAAMIHFHLPDGRCYLHTGDFRACKPMQAYSLLVNRRINVLYLDTTYCNPRYRFPPKEEVLSFVVRTTKACLKRQPKTLIVVGAYSIGKECVYIAISEALKVKIYANPSRRRVLKSFEWPHLSESLCTDGKNTPLHILPISSLRHETLKNYLKTYKDQFAAVVAFRPTGWTFSESVGSQLDLIKPNSKGNIQIYGVPYSEHSSFTEMKEFVQFLRPDKIIPTVNISSAASREKLQSHFRQWLS